MTYILRGMGIRRGFPGGGVLSADSGFIGTIFGGATDNSGADNTQALLDACQLVHDEGGGIVYIQRGVYDFTPMILNFDNVTIQGEGWGTVMRLENRGTFGSGFIRIGHNGEANYLNIRDLCIDDNKASDSGAPGGNADCLDPKDGAHNCTFDNLRIINALVDAIDMDGGSFNTVSNCLIEDANAQAILIDNQHHRIINNVIRNCNGGDRGAIAVKTVANSRAFIMGNTVINPTDDDSRNYDIRGGGTVFLNNLSYGGDRPDNLTGAITDNQPTYP